jgi:ABC-type multidrug transport system fused ATPase/permease subunit
MISVVCVICATLVLMMVILVPVIAAYILCWLYFQRTSRELKRLDSISRSPVYAHFSQSLNGLSSIRAYRTEAATLQTSHELIDTNIGVNLAVFSSNRWLGVRLEVLGSSVVLSCALLLVLQRGEFSGSVAGLVLVYALQVTGLFTRMVRSGAYAVCSFFSTADT